MQGLAGALEDGAHVVRRVDPLADGQDLGP